MDIAIYGYHDASVCLKQNDQYYIYELERFAKKRYAILTENDFEPCVPIEQFDQFFQYIKSTHNIQDVDTLYYNQLVDKDIQKLTRHLNIKNIVFVGHHEAHAHSVLAQSPFANPYIITYDGDGFNEDGTLSSFVAWKVNNNKLEKIKDFQPWNNNTLGSCYLVFSDVIKQITKQKNTRIGLSNAGKLMGLCSYGRPIEKWKPLFEKFFDNNISFEDFKNNIQLGDLSRDSLDGVVALDFAATTQWAFENKFFKNFDSLKIPRGSSICLSGGCALNIRINQMLHDRGYKVFVSPNSGDCGLTLGMLVKYNNDRNVNITYSGFPILDPDYTDNSCISTPVSNQNIAELLYNNKKILGYIHGNSECGPRALGNRSILCYPDIQNLKNILNAKVKFREWYRPFGAITKLENIHKYFTNACESPYMNFCPTLKPEYRLPSITHIDNTCRIQTVTQQQHPHIYEILTHIENMGGIGILLNTSFNIKGQPILTTRKDAFDIINTTQLDGFVHNNTLFTKSQLP